MLAVTFVLVTTLIFVRSYINFTMRTIRLPRWMGKWSPLPGAEDPIPSSIPG